MGRGNYNKVLFQQGKIMGDSSLRDIVKAFQAGSCEAFAELVGRYQNLATSIAFANSGDLQRSEDLSLIHI